MRFKLACTSIVVVRSVLDLDMIIHVRQFGNEQTCTEYNRQKGLI